MRNIVGVQVKKARRMVVPKLTQAQLAAKLQLAGWNIDRVGVAKIEIGIKEVNDFQVVILAKALGVSAGWLLGESNEDNQ